MSDDFYRLVAKHSSRCLSVLGASDANGAAVVQWDCNGSQDQHFRLEPVNPGAQ